MQSFSNIKVIALDVYIGAQINNCIREAISFSKNVNYPEYSVDSTLVSFEFNDVIVSVKSDSNPDLIYRDWVRAYAGYIDKNVGPYPNPVLTDEEVENDARIEAENQRRDQQRRAELQAKADAKRDVVTAKLATAPEIEISNKAAWEEWKAYNRDDYGRAIVAYAERWARLMQIEISSGKELDDIAEATSSEADIDGITGFMYGTAVSALAATWEYGDQLRKWHNKQYGITEDTEGVVNPAILTISTD